MSNISLREFLKHNIVIEGVQGRHDSHDVDDAKEDKEWHCHVYGAHPLLNNQNRNQNGQSENQLEVDEDGYALSGQELSVPIAFEKWGASPHTEGETESLSDPNPSPSFLGKRNYAFKQGHVLSTVKVKRQKCAMMHSIHPSMAMSRKERKRKKRGKHSPNVIDGTLLDL